MKKTLFDEAKEYHDNLPEKYREYLNKRGLNNDTIDKNLLGYANIYSKDWLTIPIFSTIGEVKYFRLRRLPEYDDKEGNKYSFYPSGNSPLRLVGIEEALNSGNDRIFICEGELDRLMLIQNGINMPVITGSTGVASFSNNWIEQYLSKFHYIYICFDNDDAGEKAMVNLVESIKEKLPNATIKTIHLPQEVGEKGDITDYFVKELGDIEKLISSAELVVGSSEIDPTQFKEMTLEDVKHILDYTIKKDDANKLIIFLAMLLTYTEESQINVILSGQSSSGKTFLVKEVSSLFPQVDIKEYGRISPTALWYSNDDLKVDNTTGQKYIDLENKIVIMLDLPDSQVQQSIRPLLSHDRKEISNCTTNKNNKGSNVASKVVIRGFSSFFFCSANSYFDEQESSRAIILSPDIDTEKIHSAINLRAIKASDQFNFRRSIEDLEDRNLLKDRIIFIKNLHIKQINIVNYNLAEDYFYKTIKGKPQPKDTRNFEQFLSIIQAITLLNAMFREINNDGCLLSTDNDIHQAFLLWKSISKNQQYGVSSQAFDFYSRYIIPAYKEKNKDIQNKEDWVGVTQDELASHYYRINGHTIDKDTLKKRGFLAMLSQASLVSYAKDGRFDGRNFFITPLVDLNNE